MNPLNTVAMVLFSMAVAVILPAYLAPLDAATDSAAALLGPLVLTAAFCFAAIAHDHSH